MWKTEDVQRLVLSYWLSYTAQDEYWDRGLLDNQQFPVVPLIDEIMDGSRQVFTPYVSNRPSSVTGPKHLSGSQLRLTRHQAQNTLAFSIPIDSSGIRISAFFLDASGPVITCIHLIKLCHLLIHIFYHLFGIGLVLVGMVKGHL